MNKIGKLKLGGELFLAPMADYTNIAFRTLCRKYGSALVCTELISAKALCMKNKRTQKMITSTKKEKPVALQLFGNNPSDFAKAIQVVEKNQDFDFDLYDLNCGCSVPKAFKGKYGVSLMNNPALVREIISEMKSATEKPIAIKMRLGIDSKKENFLEVAEQAENAGASAIALHTRFGSDGYSGKADWTKIKELKQVSKVPIIANGDIDSPEKVLQIKKETNCDFEMIGRGAIGNAFFFSQGNALLAGEKVPERTKKEIIKEFETYFALVRKHNLRPNDIRPGLIGFAKGQQGAAQLRNKISLSKSISEMQTILEEFFGEIQ